MTASVKKKRCISYKEPLAIDKSIPQKNKQLVSLDDVLKPFAVPVLDSYLLEADFCLSFKCSTLNLYCWMLA